MIHAAPAASGHGPLSGTVTTVESVDDEALSRVTILDWLDRPSDGSGLHFAGPGDEWHFESHAQLATRVRQAAGQLRAAAVAPGDVVVLVCPTSPDFVAGFFGSLLCGATPSVLATPSAIVDRGSYLEHLRRGTRLVGARAVLTVPEHAETVGAAALDCPVLCIDPTGAPLSDVLAPPETGMIQFSSGSTGPQRAVRIPYGALNANIHTLRRWLRYTRDDSVATWLPLHHDMGLVSSLLGPFINQTDVWLMKPEQFVRSPVRWLRCHTAGGATASGCPPFGLAHLLRRVRPRDLTGMDFSGWRSLVTGAERIDPAVLEAFADLLTPFGFRRETMLPAYGLAEATLAVTGLGHDETFRSVSVDPGSLRGGSRVLRTPADDGALRLTDCGAALPGMRVDIVDDDGAPLPPGVLGEIAVGGGSLASAYLTDEGERPLGSTIRTGDAGFLLDDRLFVVGRIGDSVKLRGKWLFAEDLDHVAAAASPRPRKTVVLLGDTTGQVLVVVAVEGGAGDASAALGTAVHERTEGAHVQVRTVPTGWIAVTTSGKLRRREMWRRLHEEAGTTTVTWDSETGGGGRG